MKGLDELTLKLLDDMIDEDELGELAELTQESQGQQSLLKMMELESHLQALGRSSIAERVLEHIQQERCERVEDGVMRAVNSAETAVSRSAQNPGKSLPLSYMVVGVAAIAACLILVVLQLDGLDRSEVAVAQLDSHFAHVSILRADGKSRPVTGDEPITLHQDETILTPQEIESAEIRYADGTTIELLGQTEVRLSESAAGSKHLNVLSGLIRADVAPQPKGRPLRITTPTATLDILGTTLGVEVHDSSTQLEVATGLVAMTRKVDGERVEVEAGHLATATESTDERLTARPFPKLSDVWSEDFDEGLPHGWWAGELVSTEDGNAVRAAGDGRGEENNIAVTTYNAWREGEQGLFNLHANSILHIRFRQDEFAPLRVMLVTRAYPPGNGRLGTNLYYENPEWNELLEASQWRTISIPLADISYFGKRKQFKQGVTEVSGLTAFILQITTMEVDIGLTVDRIWVTR